MHMQIYQIDAFADTVFTGNPAAICPLDSWLSDDKMQAIAVENNLSETAFFVPEGEDYRLRWFTPACEVDLCGHATLATAHLLLHRLYPEMEAVRFLTRSGPLTVVRENGRLTMDLPVRRAEAIEPPADIIQAIGAEPESAWAADDYMLVFGAADAVRSVRPDMAALTRVDRRGVIVTAPGEDCDFVSRFFAPSHGIPEDPVTGSAHCTLVPYWADRLGKTDLHARQISARGGEIWCRLAEDRVRLSGKAVIYLEGEIQV